MNLNERSNASKINEEVRRVWNANAEYWDSRMGEGNEFHRRLLLPVLERLIKTGPGTRILDVACGNGQLSRWMAKKGVDVVGIDISEKMIDIARSRTNTAGLTVDYRVMDVSDEDSAAQLLEEKFDCIVSNMAIMDMPEIEPLAKIVGITLRAGGNFVFSSTHPCLNRADMRKFARESEEEGHTVESFGVEVTRYISTATVKGVAILGQPESQTYFERPMSLILNTFLKHGLVIDEFAEPTFYDSVEKRAEPWYSWLNFKEIPPVVVVRFRRIE